jgi:hypothetical protein
MNQRTRPRSSKSRARSAASSAKPRESSDEFCKRLGIRTVNEKGGVEFSPYHGGNLSAKKPTPETHKKPEAKFSPEEQKIFDLLEWDMKRKLSPQEIFLSLQQARDLGEL